MVPGIQIKNYKILKKRTCNPLLRDSRPIRTSLRDDHILEIPNKESVEANIEDYKSNIVSDDSEDKNKEVVKNSLKNYGVKF